MTLSQSSGQRWVGTGNCPKCYTVTVARTIVNVFKPENRSSSSYSGRDAAHTKKKRLHDTAVQDTLYAPAPFHLPIDSCTNGTRHTHPGLAHATGVELMLWHDNSICRPDGMERQQCTTSKTIQHRVDFSVHPVHRTPQLSLWGCYVNNYPGRVILAQSFALRLLDCTNKLRVWHLAPPTNLLYTHAIVYFANCN